MIKSWLVRFTHPANFASPRQIGDLLCRYRRRLSEVRVQPLAFLHAERGVLALANVDAVAERHV